MENLTKVQRGLSDEDLTVEEQRAQTGPPVKRERHTIYPIVRYQGRKIIVLGAVAVALVPVAAWAKGPIVRATEDAWSAILRFLGL